MSESEDFINFRVKYKNLKVDTEFNIKDSTDKKSVIKHLDEIDSWIDSNIYKIFDIDTHILDKFISSYNIKSTNNKFSYAAEILSSKDVKRVVSDSCKNDKKIEPIARSYLISKILREIKLI